MKILLAICTLLLIGCGPRVEYYHSELEEVKTEKEIQDWELINGARVDTFFLDYQFGMSEHEYFLKSNKLLNEERIDSKNESQFTYSFITNYGDYEFDLVPGFENDTLTTLTLRTNEQYISFIPIELAYLEKYSLPNVRFEGDDDRHPFFKYFKGNLSIQGMKIGNVITITYSDENRKNVLRKKNSQKSEQTLTDI